MTSMANDSSNHWSKKNLSARTNSYVHFNHNEVEQSIPARFEQQCHKYPTRLAIKSRNLSTSYETLNRMANRVAQVILAEHNEARPVALMASSDAASFAAILGVLKAGKIAVPLDTALSMSRARFILEDTEAQILLANDATFTIAQQWCQNNTRLINIERLDFAHCAENPGLHLPASAYAHILYTSGSTGQPKGVLDVHRNVLHHVMRVTNRSYISHLDRMAVLRPPSSSGALMNAFSALLNGASLYLSGVKELGLVSLADWLVVEKITYLHCSAILFRHFAQLLIGEEAFPDLRIVKLSSGSMTKTDVELFKRHFPDCVLMHVLSSTEAFTYRINFIDKVSDVASPVLPVGYPVEDMNVSILDDEGQELGFGAIGEIAVTSPFLFECYWKQPALTDSVLKPLAGSSGRRIFRTGDIGRMRPDGCLEYLGRKDSQLKIRGHTIQPEEVELALRRAPEIAQAVVLGLPDGQGDTRLVAYVAPSPNQDLTVGSMREFLKEQLPEYMLPSAFVVMDALPLKEGGKIDRDSLPLPGDARPPLAQDFIEPRTPLERIIAKICSEILAIGEVGVKDNFFDLGGDSIVSSKVLAALNRIFPAGMSMEEFFQCPTVEAMAQLLEATEANAEQIDRLARPSVG